TKRCLFLRREYSLALTRLNARLVEVYEQGDVDSVDVILGASTLSDLVDGLDYVNQVGAADERIATSVGHAKDAARAAREATRKLRGVVAGETRAVRARTEQVRAIRNELVSSRQQLVAARSTKRVSLVKVRASEREEVSEAQALEQVSAALGAQIQAAQSASSYSPPASRSASGFIWPVSGPVTSPFGMRWGRMHTGIDIGVPYGTPIRGIRPGHLRRLDGRIRQSRLHRPRPRDLDGLCAPVEHRGLERAGHHPGTGGRLRRLYGTLLRAAPPLRGARERDARRSPGLSLVSLVLRRL